MHTWNVIMSCIMMFAMAIQRHVLIFTQLLRTYNSIFVGKPKLPEKEITVRVGYQIYRFNQILSHVVNFNYTKWNATQIIIIIKQIYIKIPNDVCFWIRILQTNHSFNSLQSSIDLSFGHCDLMIRIAFILI